MVRLRSRQWLVEEVRRGAATGESAVVTLACADDDAQGESLEVFWDHEPDRRILEAERWDALAQRGFDPPRRFAAFLRTLRWNCVTATDPRLFQAPFRAGIRLDAYQLEPLRRALRLPRVNLFIADDTGLGKTIEAGLVARELILRKKANRLVVAAPPSVLEQWKVELEDRFGLVFVILDRAYFARMRREHGFGVNPWSTHSRFLVSHNLLIAPTYADPMRAWMGEMRPGSLLILDEAHHAAPASGGRYGIETKFTRAVRDLSRRFEHRLFLSATPHNGHSNSFSTLLELLDPFRFTRGVRAAPRELDRVMVRRLKEDLRQMRGGFPERRVERVVIAGLPPDAPELELSRLLDAYRTARAERFAAASAKARAHSGLLVVGLQQRLLSSIEAFARSLGVHRKTVERQQERAGTETSATADPSLLLKPPDADDERSELTPEDAEAEDAAQVEAATRAGASGASLPARERQLLDRMVEIAERSRRLPGAKGLRLLDWIRENQCPGLPRFGERPAGAPPRWNERRVLIFTENREGTKHHLQTMLETAIRDTDRAAERIAVITGLTGGARRKEIQHRFNQPPERDPLRILIATDAAREGLNFQAHCADLFHFDLPWNPGRIEQRNGRIDRKLQPAAEVRCHYFVLPQRVEDRVLEVLVRKTETIRRELGSIAPVLHERIERSLRRAGIGHATAAELQRTIGGAEPDAGGRRAAGEELAAVRKRRDDLERQIEACRSLLDGSRRWTRFEPEAFREALSCSLEMLGAAPLAPQQSGDGPPRWVFPPLDRRGAADPGWTATLDTLRPPRRAQQTLAEWRKKAPIRPVVFEDPGVLSEDQVLLHLEQRVAQRLLARFRAQGFVHHDLSRACLVQAADSIPRVVLLGRLCVFGRRAERLHEELVPVAARWSEPSRRRAALAPYAREAEKRTLDLLERFLGRPGMPPEPVRRRLLAAASRDIAELKPHLERRAAEQTRRAESRLRERGEAEARDLRETLEGQRDRVERRLAQYAAGDVQLRLFEGLGEQERRQVEDDAREWKRRLRQFDSEIETEPDRIRRFYDIRHRRVEPVGLAYLWPDTS